LADLLNVVIQVERRTAREEFSLTASLLRRTIYYVGRNTNV
jgi:hypothetical protein